MAWSAPMTAVANATFTSAQFNQYVRDNLLECAPAKATTPGRLIVTTGPNAITERVVTQASISTSETTTSTSYTDLATTGPTVTVTTGSTALVIVSARMSNSTASASCYAAVTVSGASSVAAQDAAALKYRSSNANDDLRASAANLMTGLTPGSNSFTAQYRVTSGTGTFLERRVLVMAL